MASLCHLASGLVINSVVCKSVILGAKFLCESEEGENDRTGEGLGDDRCGGSGVPA